MIGGLAAAELAACKRSGDGPELPAGDSWTLPLVGPLEEGLLVVPALVNATGPFLFALDTDAHISSVDTDLIQTVAPRTGEGPDVLDETDTHRDRFYAEINEWQLGSLTIANRPAQIVPAHTFDIEGRRIHGVIGRDILGDALVFSFDRHRGEITLTRTAAFTRQPAWTSIAITKLHSRIENAQVLPPARKLVDATINGTPFRLHLDFGATASQLRARSWSSAKLVESPLEGVVVDEVGSPRKVTKQGVAATVTLGSAEAKDVAFITYVDRRWPLDALEGTLGLDFYKPFAVHVDWEGALLYLTDRAPLGDVKTRIGRWQSRTLSGCERVGCVKINLIDPLANKPEGQRPATHPGVVVSISREPQTLQLDLEILVAVTAADGTTPLEWLLVNMPAGVDRTLAHLPASYVGATTTVLDASPFPRECPQAVSADATEVRDGRRGREPDEAPSPQGGCVDRLRPPQPFKAADTPAVPPATP